MNGKIQGWAMGTTTIRVIGMIVWLSLLMGASYTMLRVAIQAVARLPIIVRIASPLSPVRTLLYVRMARSNRREKQPHRY